MVADDATQHPAPRPGLTSILALAALASFILPVTLWFTGSREQGPFVGLWIPSIHSLGSVALRISGDRRG